jgi:large subunit ribosomal protein L18
MKVTGKRRRIEGKTNYTKRRRLLEGRKPRIVIRKTNKYILIQYVESKVAQDVVKCSSISGGLIDYGWLERKTGSLKSLGAAYLTGFLFGNKMKELGLEKNQAILDTGLIRSTRGSRVYAAVKGMIDAGVKIACNPEVFPEEKRIKSENINEFFDKVKENITKNAGGKKK